jgi:uncharacterized membrane protein YphA (DoxX/SURF4 family)
MSNTDQKPSRAANAALWTVQALLAALFLFAGSMKFIMPVAAMTQQVPLSGTFLHFIGIMELLGGLGLVLPGIFDVRRELTPLAAAGLVIIMSGAVGVTLVTGTAVQALMPGVVGIIAAGVSIARWRLRPVERSRVESRGRYARPSTLDPSLCSGQATRQLAA